MDSKIIKVSIFIKIKPLIRTIGAKQIMITESRI